MNPIYKLLTGLVLTGGALCAGFVGISAANIDADMLAKKRSLNTVKTVGEWAKKHRTSPGQKNTVSHGLKAEAVAAAAQNFQCVLTYSDDWDDYSGEAGVYTFSSAAPIKFRSEFVSDDYTPSGGAFFTDKYYILSTMSEDWFTGEVEVYTYKYSRSDWDEISYSAQSAYSLFNAICYDPIDNLAYGYFYSDNGGAWGYMNPDNMKVTHLAEMSTELVAVAIDEQGKAYGVTSAGDFCLIDKSTGAVSIIGNTGLDPEYMQSAAFGADGTLYWAASEAYSSGLYTVDTATGKASLISYFNGTEEVCALYAVGATPDSGAPDKAENLKADVSGADLTFPFSFTVPAKTAGGGTLSGEVSYAVTIDGVNAATGVSTPGASVELSLTVASPGYHLFKVTLSNTSGSSAAESLRVWIGVDEPMPVKDAAVEKIGDKTIKVTWTAPTAGVNGGFFNADLISYTLVRLPEGKVVAENLTSTSFTDEIDLKSGQSLIRYLITPVADGLGGKAVETQGVVIGAPYQIPVDFSFNTQEEYNIFTVIDNNETVTLDSGLWQYSPSGEAAGYVGGTKDGDDWLITPSFRLKANTQYIISHDVLCYSDNWPEEYDVYLGTSPTIEGMTTQIVKPTTIWWDEYRTNTVTVTVPADGVYYLGFHATSEAGSAFFLLDNIKIRESYNLLAPAEVKSFNVEAGENGAKKASITFTTPFNNVKGEELDDDLTVRICRNGVVIKIIYDVAPDEQMTYEDSDPVDRSMNEYSVYCSTYYGQGPAATSSVWVGVDAPSAPINAKVELDAAGHPVITWEQPEGRGVHGGYVDNADLSYSVAYATNGGMTKVADKISGLTCTDTDLILENTGAQAMHQYYIVPSSNVTDEYGENATALYISGKPYAMPFKESFKGGKATNFWAFTGTNGEGWGIGDDFSIGSQDDDNGVLYYLPAVPEVTATAMSGKIDISNAANPCLTFYLRKMSIADNGYYDTDPSKDVLHIKAGADNFNPATIKSIPLTEIKTLGEYIYYTVSLKELGAKDFVVVAFEYEAVSDRTPIMIDNVTVKDMCDYNVLVGQIEAPEAVDVMEDLSVSVEVMNSGNNRMENIAVRLMSGDTVETESVIDALDPEKSATVTLETKALPSWGEKATFTVSIVADKDEIEGDNVSESFSVDVLYHERPAVTDLTSDINSGNNSLELSWSAPDGLTQTETRVTETFESYNHGDQTFGDWKSEDKSFWGFAGVKTITVDGVKITIPGSDDSQAFMVFDPVMAGINLDESPEWEPVSGSQLIVSFGDAANDDMEANNDWLVSPELSGKKQTISFWARTGAKKGKPDEIRVYSTAEIEYNASGTVKTSSFTAVAGGDITLTREWVKYEYELPAGTKYFAIRNLSDDGFAVLIDDITYEPYVEKTNANFEGYNIYRDGALLNSTPVSETYYTVSPIVYGKYTVRVVYDEGESDDSNEVMVINSGIDSIETSAEDDAVYYDLNGIRVPEPQEGKIYILKNRKVVYRR